MLGPILLEKHQECSRIEGARLGNLFISRQGLRANTPAISLHQLDPIRIQSVSISNSPRCTQGQSAVASVHRNQTHSDPISRTFMRATCTSASQKSSNERFSSLVLDCFPALSSMTRMRLHANAREASRACVVVGG